MAADEAAALRQEVRAAGLCKLQHKYTHTHTRARASKSLPGAAACDTAQRQAQPLHAPSPHAQRRAGQGRASGLRDPYKTLAHACRTPTPTHPRFSRAHLTHVQAADLTRRLLLALVPPEPSASRPALLEVRAGAGGAEAALFASELLAMYRRLAQARTCAVWRVWSRWPVWWGHCVVGSVWLGLGLMVCEVVQGWS